MLTKCAPHEFLPCISGVYRVHSLAQLSESSDVYSFGVFLLELITGREAAGLVPPESKDTFAQLVSTNLSKANQEKKSLRISCLTDESLCQMEARFSSNELVDPRLGGSFTSEGMAEVVGLAFQCLSPSARRRPRMRLVAAELDRILEKEMTLTTVMGDGTAIVTLGSQLFTS
jgi:serine/threonine protein kinase